MKIYQIDRSEVFSKLADGKKVYAANIYYLKPFRDLRAETVDAVKNYINDKNWDFIIVDKK